MKTIKRIINLLILGTLILTGCSTGTDESTDNEVMDNVVEVVEAINLTENEVDEEIAIDYSDKDLKEDYDLDDASFITLDNRESNSENVEISDTTITIFKEGTYIISGEFEGQIVVNADSEEDVRLILDGVNITNLNGPAIYVQEADKVIITLVEGTINNIEDGSNYTTSEDIDAAIYATEDLSINGTGTLNVIAKYAHAIKSTDDLVITNGTINIESVGDGLKGKDSVQILAGNITINADDDGIKSSNTEDTDKGYIVIDGGDININSNGDGIEAENFIYINNGELSINVSDDAINSSDIIEINGGTMTLTVGDDGIHADNILTINGENITITDSYEGLEAAALFITDGIINVSSSDDGFNAAGGSDDDSNSDIFTELDNYILSISGGDIYVNADGDGLDSNGDIEILAGTVIVDGPSMNNNSAIDINKGDVIIEEASLIAIGSSGMLVTPTQVSQPVLTIIYDSTQTYDSTVTVFDSNGNEVLTINPAKSYQSIMMSHSSLETGNEYTIVYSNGDEVTITLTDDITTIDQNGNETTISSGMSSGKNRR